MRDVWMWTYWHADAVGCAQTQISVNEKEKEKKLTCRHLNVLRGRTDALRADVLHADADDCEKERRKEKLTKYKSWRTDLYADTSHVRADADGGGE